MTKDAREVMERALALPHDARAELVHRLIESLVERPDEDPAEVERAWRAEIERRLRDAVEGRDPGIPADEVMAEGRALLERLRAGRRS